MPSLSPQMMYLLTTDIEQQGKEAILRQLARLFEADLEELLHPALLEAPEVVMTYDSFEDDWDYHGDRSDKTLLMHTYQLAKAMQTGETDDETYDLMRHEGWSSIKGLKEEVDKVIQLITAYPFFWRAIKYQDQQQWLKSYFEQTKPEYSTEEKIVTAFWLDMQELARFVTQAGQQKMLWFAKKL